MRKLLSSFTAALIGAVLILSPVPASAQTPTTPEASLVTNSFYNQVATSWPVDPQSANMVAGFVRAYQDNYGAVSTTEAMPIFYAPAGTTDVQMNVQTSGCGGGGGNFLPDLPNGGLVPITSTVTADWSNTQSSDNPLVIYSPSEGYGWEFWQARYNFTGFPDEWSACFGGAISLASGNGNLPTGGLSATRISYLATAITENDVASGQIDHAMAIDLPDCDGGIYPATNHDCAGAPCDWTTSAANCYPSEGSYLRFSSSVNCANYDLTAMENMVCVAGQKYGFVDTDFAGAVTVNTENPYDWAEQGNVGNGPEWGQNGVPNSGCNCQIVVPGGDPISQAEIYLSGSNQGQQAEGYQDITGLPWSQLEVIDPPGYTPPEAVSQSCTQQDGQWVDTLTWSGGPADLNYGGYDAGTQSSPLAIQDADASVYVTINGINSPTINAVCD